MKDIIFENEEGTQRITVKAKDNGDNIDFTVEFYPKYSEQDNNSTHTKLATAFLQAITDSIS